MSGDDDPIEDEPEYPDPTEVDYAALAIVDRIEAITGWDHKTARSEAQALAQSAINALRGEYKLLHESEWNQLREQIHEVANVPFGAHDGWMRDGNTADTDRMQEWEDARQALLTDIGEWCPASGGDHTWTDAVGPEHEHLRPEQRWHCDECGASPPRGREPVAAGLTLKETNGFYRAVGDEDEPS